MPKFFVASDIHGFYDEYIKALDEAGYDKDNPDHYLIVCGDCFDRGPKPDKVMQFLNLNKRAFLIKGNHESLFIDCCNRGYPNINDTRNGTTETIRIIGNPDHSDKDFFGCASYSLNRTEKFFDKFLKYFETENYIFVHGYIPVIIDDNYPVYYTKHRKYYQNDNWREAKYAQWEQATWLNGIDMALTHNIRDKEKTIVFGHWHCSYAHARVEGKNEFGENSDFSPFYGDGFIAIDACTVYTKKVNVIVIEDEFLPDYKERMTNEWKAII